MNWNTNQAVIFRYFHRSCLASFESLDDSIIEQFIGDVQVQNHLLAFVKGEVKAIAIQLIPENAMNNKTSMLRILNLEEITRPIYECTIYFNKINGCMSTDLRLGSQITVMTVTDQDIADYVTTSETTTADQFDSQNVNSVAIMRSYLHNTLNPLINTFKKEDRADTAESSLLKRVADLDMALIHYEQNLDIPDVHLTFPPFLVEAADKCRAADRLLSSHDLGWGDKPSQDILNQLMNLKSQWMRDIHKLTDHTRNLKQGTTLQEINYWSVMKSSLESVSKSLDSYEVQVLISVLKSNNLIVSTGRFETTSGLFENSISIFENTTGLKSKTEEVTGNVELLSSIPMNSLFAASDFPTMKTIVLQIFTELKRIKTINTYSIQRMVDLTNSINKDVYNQCITILSNQHIFSYSYTDFTTIIRDCFMICKTWNDESVSFWQVLREILSKRNDNSAVRFKNMLSPLEERLKVIQLFRDNHERFMTILHKSIVNDEKDHVLISQMSNAFDRFNQYNISDMSDENMKNWTYLTKNYNDVIEQVENEISEHIKNEIDKSRSIEQMFTLFSKYNMLFFRPRIQAAIQQYQSGLLELIRKEIENLSNSIQDMSFPDSEEARFQQLHGIPTVGGSVMWAKQIEHALNEEMKRIEVLLGSEWEKHQEGRKLRQLADTVRHRIDTSNQLKQWTDSTLSRIDEQPFSSVVFLIKHNPAAGYTITLNYDEAYFTLFKEIRTLTWLGHRPPVTIRVPGESTEICYSRACTLQSSLIRYNRIIKETDSGVMSLASEYHQAVRDLIKKAIQEKLTWQSKKLKEFTIHFSRAVLVLQEKTTEIASQVNMITKLKLECNRCNYTYDAFASLLKQIQTAIDTLFNLHCYNIDAYNKSVNEEIITILSKRVNQAVKTWIIGFKRRLREEYADMMQEEDAILEERDSVDEPIVYDDILKINTVHMIRVSNHSLVVNPPIAESKKRWLTSLLTVITTVTNLPRLKGMNDVFISAKNMVDEEDYSCIASLIDKTMLMSCFDQIEQLISNANSFVTTWLRNQAIWRLNPKEITEKLGNNVSLWQELLMGLMKAKGELDTENVEKIIGCIHINLEQIQSSMSLRYESLHKDLLTSFGNLIYNQTKSFVTQLNEARDNLEHFTINASTHEAISLILATREVTHNIPLWQSQHDSLLACHTLLEQQYFTFPNEWIYTNQIENDWSSLQQIVNRRQDKIKASKEQLKKNIITEDTKLKAAIATISEQWEEKKPLDGSLSVQDALTSLQEFKDKITNLNEKWLRVNQGRDALGLDIHIDNPIDLLLTELKGLQEAWETVQPFWARLSTLGDILWSVFVPKQFNQELIQLERDIETIPSRVKQYSCFTSLQTTIRTYKKDYKLLQDLKNSSLKERHWNTILSTLHIQCSYEFLHIRDFWSPAFHTAESKINEIISIAQGEMAIEEFLKQIREYWTGYVLELVPYQQRCKLIRGWDELFTKLDEHLSALGSMKQSPYYSVFADEATNWEDKVTRMHVLFDVWIDVQRRWIYLEGIFMSGADIIQQLPQDYNRFKSIDTDFVNLMRKVTIQPRILDVFNITNIQRTLERLSQQLTKIQKALGEFLEKQRQLFSRFYFVGDEDLLEIIGNNNDPVKVQRHLNKMFAGINALEYHTEDNGDIMITSMVSKEGEIVPFVEPVMINKGCSVVSWLSHIEETMRKTLAVALQQSLHGLATIEGTSDSFIQWILQYPSQIIILSTQIAWSRQVETALRSQQSTVQLQAAIQQIDAMLQSLAERVIYPLQMEQRKKYEQLITEFMYEKSTIQNLIDDNVKETSDFNWQYRLRAYYNEQEQDIMKRLSIHVADAEFYYGFEYLGICERLVQTPLTDRCYLTLTQALKMGLGGNPFGPAGTGKTESVKMLASLLGRFCLVFNCDESFDFQAMGRIFRGLCQVGAWGCFDEFNRLEERILSAVSQQIWTIQTGLRDQQHEIRLLDKPVKLHPNVGIFVTMNPGYAGRSNLPDNLKQLFRGIAMIQPDREKIAQNLLFSQGFRTSETLAGKLVMLFSLCRDQLSSQAHYDFELRALKSVVVSAGNLKRQKCEKNEELLHLTQEQQEDFERDVLISSVCNTVVPKLVSEDLILLQSLLSSVFTGASIKDIEATQLRVLIKEVCKEHYYRATDEFVEKALQLYLVQELRHGIMLVGPSGSGKSAILHCLQEALERLDNQQGVIYTIDPKAITKDQLFGSLDITTNEWTDGIFTHIIREIYNDVRGESSRRYWIVFDGDVDPEWAENLNSVLDDNKLLTLPTGDRLSLPSNVRILFEVENLKYATPASVSRCGTVWFSKDTVKVSDILYHTMLKLRNIPVMHDMDKTQLMTLQNNVVDIFLPYCDDHCLVEQCLTWSMIHDHIMETTEVQLILSFESLLHQIIIDIVDYNMEHLEVPMQGDHLMNFVSNRMIEAIVWGFGGSLVGNDRLELSEMIKLSTGISLPTSNTSIVDYYVGKTDGQWHLWIERVPHVDVTEQSVVDTSVVIPTVDTLRNQHLMRAYLTSCQPIILCGPPGSGKTMTLTDTLKSLTGYDVVSVNFSSTTLPSVIMKIFEQYGTYQKTPSGLILHPVVPDKHLIIFCDEVNLPEQDQYGTQRVITFLRQLVEQQGFWNTKEHLWVHIENIQFVAACNPPTDPGRIPLSTRFLSHAPVLFVDYPERTSLMQIYSVFNKVVTSTKASICNYYNELTELMVSFYQENKVHFLQEQQPQYVYSPRELSRWVRALHAAFTTMNDVTLNELIRLTAYEALRLFSDRLVTHEEKQWCYDKLCEVVFSIFTNVSPDVLRKPILYSDWLTGQYCSVDHTSLYHYLEDKLRLFNEEELNVPLVLFDDALEHVIRIDRVLKQPLGHLLLVGQSGAGKTVLSRFVAWINDMTVFQIKVSRRYDLDDFDNDLRDVMKLSGINGQQVCFIFDESNILSTGFLERMNALLASGEVPGLYEGDDMLSLMAACREVASKEGYLQDSAEELFKWFTSRVQRNLHVVFTMNPANGDFRNRAATSPALFNRCVVDWFGTWDRDALVQVSQYFIHSLALDKVEYHPSEEALQVISKSQGNKDMNDNTMISLQHAVTAAILNIHQGVTQIDNEKTSDIQCYCSPRDYLDFINHYLSLYQSKHEELEDQQHHLRVGLSKLNETEEKVRILKKEVSEKEKELSRASKEAQEKLKLIIEKKELATKNREKMQVLSEQIRTQYDEIAEKRARVNHELSQVEPLLLEAKNSVKQINKNQLKEMRTMIKPPTNVQLTIQAVCCLLGEDSSSWKEIQKTIRKEDFIPNIINFQTTSLTPKHAEEVKNLLNTPDFNYETALRSSRACGPLYKWVKSQLEYSYIIQRVKPLNDELTYFTQTSEQLRKQYESCNATVDNLDKEVEGYSKDYEVLTQRCQSISESIQIETEKSSRSTRLLSSLESEQHRWKESSAEFMKELSNMIGDCLLGASFMTYGGFFDQHHRICLLDDWKQLLTHLCIPYTSSFDVSGYLSTSKERLIWQSNGLPSDDLCIQNAVILNRYNRYPLMIDPGGQGVNYIMNLFSNNRVIKTSFLDKNFMKQLESALRFGSILIVQDVENAEPVLNPLLNKEFHKEGGRTLIQLGDQEIDFSPSFKLFLSTRDSSHQFPPDLCSRVTFVNFTMTISSLQDQCMSIILQKEAPMLYQKRNDLLQLQGEYQARLRDLEEQLLIALNDLQGNILDSAAVMNSLEQLKTEAKSISDEISQSNEIMRSIKESSCIYQPLSQACSQIYFILDNLHRILFLYRFNLQFILDILDYVLSIPLEPSLMPSQRMSVLLQALYRTVYSRVSRGLKHIDSRIFALRLCQLYVTNTDNQPDVNEYTLLIKGTGVTIDESSGRFVTAVFGGMLNEEQEALMMMHLSLSCTSELKKVLLSNVEFWSQEFMIQPIEKLYDCIDKIGEPGWSHGKCLWRWLLLIKELRPELLINGIEYVVMQLIDADFFKGDVFILQDVIQSESKATVPILLCSAPGYDASKKIEQIYMNLHQQLDTIAMGNTESFAEAEKIITSATTRGSAVLLRNVHLCPSWLNSLEKLFFTLHPHENFRLFMTSEVNSALPPSLLRLCYVFVFETPTGIRASLKHSLNVISEEEMNAKPVERCRVYFLLLWLHAIVEERLRYVPVGWTKSYEFNESDLKCSLNVLNRWINSSCRGLSHIDPYALNWKAIRCLLSQSLYGGRVDNQFDDQLLTALIDKLFVPSSFDSNFPLVEAYNSNGVAEVIVASPDGTCKQDFERWVDSLPIYNSPTWLGLPTTAEKRYLSQQGMYILRNLLAIQDEIDVEASLRERNNDGSNSHSWMSQLSNQVEQWLSAVMIEIQSLQATPELLNNSLFRYFSREIEDIKALQQIVTNDLKSVVGVCRSNIKSTYQIRELMKCLSQDMIPKQWTGHYRSPANQICSLWMNDFILRCQNFSVISQLSIDAIRNYGVWLGGLLHPEAYITAMKQVVAQENQWSLDNVQLNIIPLTREEFDQRETLLKEHPTAFLIHDIVIEGAEWSGTQLIPSDEIRCVVEEVLFEWTCKKQEEDNCVISVPIYLNESRSDLLYVVGLKHVETIPTEMWRQRAVSIICWRQA